TLAELPDEQLAHQVAVLGRRVDHLQRRFNRHWQESLGVVLYGETHFAVSAEEWQLLQALDGRRSLGDILKQFAAPSQHARWLAGVRRLAHRGAIDLAPAQTQTNGTAEEWPAAELTPAAVNRVISTISPERERRTGVTPARRSRSGL